MEVLRWLGGSDELVVAVLRRIDVIPLRRMFRAAWETWRCAVESTMRRDALLRRCVQPRDHGTKCGFTAKHQTTLPAKRA